MNISDDEKRCGTARFAEAKDLANADLLSPSGYYLGMSDTNKEITIGHDKSGIVVAGAGGGKLVNNAVEPLLSSPDSCLVYDEKGEICAITMHAMAARNKSVYVVNFGNQHARPPWFLPCNRVNPLDILTPNNPNLWLDIQVIMELLIESSGDSRAEIFEERARDWVANILFWMIKSHNRVVDLPEVYSLLNKIEGNPDYWDKLTQRYLKRCPSESVRRVASEIEYKRKGAVGEFSGIMTTINKNFSFLDIEQVREGLQNADFSLSVLTEDQANVYLCSQSEYAKFLKPVNRLILGVAMLYKKRRPGDGKIRLLIDEAANLGHMSLLSWAYTGGRGFGIFPVTIWQSIGQISQIYGEEGLQTLLGNSHFQIFHSIGDYPSAKFVSDMLGYETVVYKGSNTKSTEASLNSGLEQIALRGGDLTSALQLNHHHKENYDQAARLLRTPDQIMQMRANIQIVYLPGSDCPPIEALKVPYFHKEKLLGLYMPNPYHRPFNQVALIDKHGKKSQHPITLARVTDSLRQYPQYCSGFYPVIDLPEKLPGPVFSFFDLFKRRA